MESTARSIERSVRPQRNRIAPFRLLIAVPLFMWAVLLASWGTVSFIVLPLTLVTVCSIIRSLNLCPYASSRPAALVSWISSLVIRARLLGATKAYSIDLYYVEFCALITIASCLTWMGNPLLLENQCWRTLSAFWAGMSITIWLCFGYYCNFGPHFFGALVSGIVLLITAKQLLKLSDCGHQVINTILLLIILLPMVDWFTRPKYHLDVDTALRKRYYSCEAANADPVAFRNGGITT